MLQVLSSLLRGGVLGRKCDLKRINIELNNFSYKLITGKEELKKMTRQKTVKPEMNPIQFPAFFTQKKLGAWP